MLRKIKADSSSLYGIDRDIRPEQREPGVCHWAFVLLISLLCTAAYYQLVFNKAQVELELTTDTRTVLKFYWANEQGMYSEKKMAQLLIKPGQNRYHIRVCDLAGLDHLRLDPSEKTAWITIKRITLRQQGWLDYTLQTADDFKNLEILGNVESLTRHPRGVTVQVKSRDPNLKIYLPQSGFQFNLFEFLHLAGIFMLSIAGYCVFHRFFSRTGFIPLLSAFVLALILVMASLSLEGVHPDEPVHLAAGKYFAEHTIPPRIGDPSIEHTYSVYGVSRLHSGEIVYQLAGKYLWFFKPLQLESYLVLRFFNIILFTILLLYGYNRADFRFFLLPILISPQIWYIFSYFNSDGFATFVGLLTAYQLAGEKSSFTAILRSEKNLSLPVLILLGILFGAVLMLKKNFYFLYVFFFLYFLWKVWIMRPQLNRKTVLRLGAVLLIGTSLFGLYRITDNWVNDFDKGRLSLEARQKYATEMYKPETPLHEKHAYLQMRERGTSLTRFLTMDRWGEKTFRTSFGVYGYTSLPASFAYYDYVRIVGLLLLLSLISSVVIRGGIGGNALLTISLGTAAALIGVACYHAWTVDFQAQGRYLLPIIPMLSVLVYHSQKMIRPMFYCLFTLMFSLSIYNFVFVGLRDIGKYGM